MRCFCCYMRCSPHYMRCFCCYMRCSRHYMRCFLHYMRCFRHYIQCVACHHYTRCLCRYMRCVLHYEMKNPEVWVRSLKNSTMQWAPILRTRQFSIPSCLCSLGDIDMDTVLKILKLEGPTKKLLKILMSTINHCCCGNHCFP